MVARQVIRRYRGVGAGIDADHVLAFGVDEDQRHAGGGVGDGFNRLGINAIARQLPADTLADIIGAYAGDKGDLRPAAPGRHRLIRALAAKRHLILFPDHRFARVGELFNIEDMVGIDAAKNHQLTCFHRIDS